MGSCWGANDHWASCTNPTNLGPLLRPLATKSELGRNACVPTPVCELGGEARCRTHMKVGGGCSARASSARVAASRRLMSSGYCRSAATRNKPEPAFSTGGANHRARFLAHEKRSPCHARGEGRGRGGGRGPAPSSMAMAWSGAAPGLARTGATRSFSPQTVWQHVTPLRDARAHAHA